MNTKVLNKTVWHLCLLCLLIVALPSCTQSSARKQLKAATEQIESQTPLDIGNGISITQFSYDTDANKVIMSMDLTAVGIPAEALRRSAEETTASLLSSIKQDRNNKFYQLIVKAGASLTIRAISNGEMVEFDIPAEDLSKAFNTDSTPEEDYAETLDRTIEGDKARCPMQIDEITTLVDVEDNGLYIIYSYTLAEDDTFTVKDLNEKEEMFRDSIVEGLDTPLGKRLMALFAANKRGVIYQYRGDKSGAKLTLVFQPEEIEMLSE